MHRFLRSRMVGQREGEGQRGAYVVLHILAADGHEEKATMQIS